MVQIVVAIIGVMGLVMVEMLRRTNKQAKAARYNTQPNGGESPYDQLLQKNDQIMQARNKEVIDRLDLIDQRTGRIESRQFNIEKKFERMVQQLESK